MTPGADAESPAVGLTAPRTHVRTDVPVDLSREAAQEAAARELARPEYHQDDPGLAEQAMTWLLERLTELLDAAAGVSPGGPAGLILLVLLVTIAVVALRARVGPLRRPTAAEQA